MERPTTSDLEPAHDQPDVDPVTGPESLDLVSIGLAVFFVSLLVVVGALLILPTVL